MDNHTGSHLSRSQSSQGVLKTIYLFLQNHSFEKSADTFKNECVSAGRNIENVLSKSVILKKCKCSKNAGNQTDLENNLNMKQHGWLEGTFEGEPHQYKRDDTQIVYVCDHCQLNNQSNFSSENEKEKDLAQNRIDNRQEMEEKRENAQNISTSKADVVHLKSKFSELQGDHQKLIAVTSELTTALQMNIVGQTKNIYSVLEQCKSIYPSLFVQPSPSNSPSPGLFDEQTIKDQTNLVSPRNDVQNSCNENYLDCEREFTKTENSRKMENRSTEPKPQSENTSLIDTLNLEILSPRSELRTPLTPQTVRQILETVFEKIFDIERSKIRQNGSKSPPLEKADVERIVKDVLEDVSNAPVNCYGSGEGKSGANEKEIVVLKNCDRFFDVDYGKLKKDLMMGDNDRKIRILQALRWRITKNEENAREKIMDSYVVNDVLDLYSGISIPERLLSLSGYSDCYVQESTCRLINAIASLRQGRDYLTIDDRLLKRVLIKKTKDIRNVSSAVIRNMLVASIQKLSIRKQCRIQMVYEGLLEVLVDYLDDFYEKLSRYCLEYCSALVMNLCLVGEAKERSSKMPKKIIGLIRKFLEGDNDCCLPYINGVMFSLLEKKEIVNEAKNQNFDKLLIRLIRSTNNENIRKQLDFIVQSRLFGTSDPSVNESEEDNREEVDLLEIELDQDDFITHLPSGEKLLEEYKSNNQDKNANMLLSSLKKDPPPTAKSFSEENKQFYHTPSTEKGIFEGARGRRFTCSQGLIRNFVKNKKLSQGHGRFSATPVCYMENCQKSQNGKSSSCSCSKCVPGQSKYSCGCHDAICREMAEEELRDGYEANYAEKLTSQMDFGKGESKTSQLSTHKNTNKTDNTTMNNKTHNVKSSIITTTENIASIDTKTDALKTSIKGGRRNGCKVCGEKKCDCAFESRPKICRTPTMS